ncbi:MAG: DUF4494 domain-containing protein [Dysgonamonadaceae bacterium]|jgi:hypothetical protein|nr:DUF4494 domain-containing protein [Dysgonamonadaceae bacterium]
MENGFNYYRIKTGWVAENGDGSLTKKKTEELVLASSYTEAEKVACAIAEDQNRAQFGSLFTFEIVKTKIGELLYNSTLRYDDTLTEGLVTSYFEEDDSTGTGLYAVKVMYIELDEKSGKEKYSSDTIYTPATSNADASDIVERFLKKNETRDFVIRDSKYDRAESILWSPQVHKEKLEASKQLK